MFLGTMTVIAAMAIVVTVAGFTALMRFIAFAVLTAGAIRILTFGISTISHKFSPL